MVGGKVRPLLPEIVGQLAPVGAISPFFNRYSPVTPSESLLRAFRWA